MLIFTTPHYYKHKIQYHPARLHARPSADALSLVVVPLPPVAARCLRHLPPPANRASFSRFPFYVGAGSLCRLLRHALPQLWLSLPPQRCSVAGRARRGGRRHVRPLAAKGARRAALPDVRRLVWPRLWPPRVTAEGVREVSFGGAVVMVAVAFEVPRPAG